MTMMIITTTVASTSPAEAAVINTAAMDVKVARVTVTIKVATGKPGMFGFGFPGTMTLYGTGVVIESASGNQDTIRPGPRKYGYPVMAEVITEIIATKK